MNMLHQQYTFQTCKHTLTWANDKMHQHCMQRGVLIIHHPRNSRHQLAKITSQESVSLPTTSIDTIGWKKSLSWKSTAYCLVAATNMFNRAEVWSQSTWWPFANYQQRLDVLRMTKTTTASTSQEHHTNFDTWYNHTQQWWEVRLSRLRCSWEQYHMRLAYDAEFNHDRRHSLHELACSSLWEANIHLASMMLGK